MPTAGVIRDARPRAKDFAVATYNIWDGRQKGFYSAVRPLREANVDIAVVQETNFLDPDFR